MTFSWNKIYFLPIIIGLILVSANRTIYADGTTPLTNDGKKWKLGYYEGGPYINYPLHLRALVDGLVQLGWMEKVSVPNLEEIALELMEHKVKNIDANNSILIWKWLARHAKSKYIQFVDNACWSANWDKALRRKNQKEVIERLKKKDVDLIIATGTWAGQDIANNEHSVPTMVMSTSDPVGAKIIKSHKDSGYDHVTAMCDPSRYIRQVRLFHGIIGFKKLGVVYENTLEGRAYASVNDIEQVARERDFEVIYCKAPFSGVAKRESTEAVIKCHTELAPKVDALYVTVHRGISVDNMSEILKPLVKHKIPTFSQRGILEVKYGVLYCVDRESFNNLGKSYSKIIAKILNGTKPRDLNQIFVEPKKIVINLKTAKMIGYDPPPNILKVADIIYSEIMNDHE
ncbi:ABC transporter substrate-binding protein [Thermodesulfobacteriota bacterium]